MPATTSRGYPYSLPADPTDIPAAIEALAEAVDADVQARADSIRPRPAFRLGSTSAVTFPTWTSFTVSKRLPFETQDALVGGAIAPVNGAVDRVVPLLPGFWWLQAYMVIPRAGGSLMDMIGITLQTGATVLARNSTHVPPPPSDGTNLLSVSVGAYFNGSTDYVEMMGTAHAATPAVGQPQMTIRNRYLFGMRMTES